MWFPRRWFVRHVNMEAPEQFLASITRASCFQVYFKIQSFAAHASTCVNFERTYGFSTREVLIQVSFFICEFLKRVWFERSYIIIQMNIKKINSYLF